jgi:PleD family two-component response regulator
MSKPLALIYYSNLMPGGQVANRLQDLGYRVQPLADLSRLVDQCKEEKPLVLLAEIIASGPVLPSIARLRKDPATQHIPVLGWSASPDPALQKSAHAAGVSLLTGAAAISEHLPQLLDQALQVE